MGRIDESDGLEWAQSCNEDRDETPEGAGVCKVDSEDDSESETGDKFGCCQSNYQIYG